MAYDETLAERKMFGGLCFTVRGHMAVGVNGDDLMVRLPPDEGEAALPEPGARPMDFTGRPMKGFLYVRPNGLRTDRELQAWVDRSVAYVASLPPKKPRKRRS